MLMFRYQHNNLADRRRRRVDGATPVGCSAFQRIPSNANECFIDRPVDRPTDACSSAGAAAALVDRNPHSAISAAQRISVSVLIHVSTNGEPVAQIPPCCVTSRHAATRQARRRANGDVT